MAVVESIASMTSVDIAAIEAKHASNRETSLLRARGWLPSLATLASKFILGTTKRIFSAFGVFRSSTSSAPKKDTDPSQPPKKKKPSGGGGPWRVFLHVRARGEKFTSESIARLLQEYQGLSPEEKEKFGAAGAAATAAHREGYMHHSTLQGGVPPHQLQSHTCTITRRTYNNQAISQRMVLLLQLLMR